MFTQGLAQRSAPLPGPEQIADVRLAASKMTGATRRAFEAEMTMKYCGGNARQAEGVFGWGRHTVELGLAERRTGIMCLGAQSTGSGRPRWEDTHTQVAEALRQQAETHAQQDPTFRTTVSYTRLTANTAIAGLRQQGIAAAILPAPSTMSVILNRLGFRLRHVVKSKPLKKVPQTEAIFANVKKKTGKPG